MMPEKPVTSYDVAHHAGVSQATVSRAFDPNGNVSAATRARVLTAARELGYQPNAIARGLSTQRTNIVGLILGNMTRSLFYPKVLELLINNLQALGKQVLIFNTSETRPVDEVLPRILSYQVDALVIASTTPGRELIDACTRMNTPVVLFNRAAPETAANAVCSDNEGGGRLVADLLLDAGHQNPAFLAGVGVTATNQLRQKGFTERLAEREHTDFLIAQGEYTYESGYQAALDLLDRDDPPDAIFCAADIMALGAMDAARSKLGISIPEELSIIGYDDISMAGWPAYDLTTIHQPVAAMVGAAIRLLSPHDGAIITGELVLLPGELVPRSSARLSPG
jgi:DNA-binding LacI/PurR family transcriptional regulator